MIFSLCLFLTRQVLPMRKWCRSQRDTGTDWNRMLRDRRWGFDKNTTVLSHKRSSFLKSNLFIWLLFVGTSLVYKISLFLLPRLQPMLGPHQPTGSSSNSSAHSGSSVVSGGMGGDCIGGGSTGGGGGLVGCGRGRGLNLKMKFVCGQCWREGQVNEPDKSLKYCTAKARHRLASIIQEGIILPPGCSILDICSSKIYVSIMFTGIVLIWLLLLDTVDSIFADGSWGVIMV